MLLKTLRKKYWASRKNKINRQRHESSKTAKFTLRLANRTKYRGSRLAKTPEPETVLQFLATRDALRDPRPELPKTETSLKFLKIHNHTRDPWIWQPSWFIVFLTKTRFESLFINSILSHRRRQWKPAACRPLYCRRSYTTH